MNCERCGAMLQVVGHMYVDNSDHPTVAIQMCMSCAWMRSIEI